MLLGFWGRIMHCRIPRHLRHPRHKRKYVWGGGGECINDYFQPAPSPSLVKTITSNILSRLTVPGSGFLGLSLSAFEICTSPQYFYFCVLLCIDNDQVFDLLSKKKIEPQQNTLPGLTASPIRNVNDFEDALTLVLLNGKIR